ncbi:hypothetical protein RI129_010911 [Pyrocoelia pectoralis]|uniref:Uncharacterized protein n=1 Tax=Pyrocoelia pectoralis TaxID=417401 RepID=A0AAN7Z9P0_9COLE
MDQFETSSNVSDCPSSNLSSISGLTGFEEELCDLKTIIRDNSFIFQDSPSFKNHLKFNEIETAVELNERYRNDYYNLECKLELVNREKFQKLRNHIVLLERQLAVSRSECCKRLNPHDCNEVSRLRDEVEQLELLNNNLKVNLEERKFDLDTKSTSVIALKKKIVDLHVEVQLSTQRNVKLNNDVNVLRNEFNSSQKSQLWYKERMHECRKEKAHLAEEVSHLHSVLINKERELNARNTECLYIAGRLEDVQVAYDRLSKLPDRSPDVETYKATICNLNLELGALKRAVNIQQESFEGIAKQNVELVTTNEVLLRSVAQKDATISNLENDRRDLLANVDILESKVVDLSRLMQDVVKVEVELKDARHEKSMVEDAVNEIRDNLAKFAERFRQIQGKLFDANRLIKELEGAKHDLRRTNESLTAEMQVYDDRIACLQKTVDDEIEKSTAIANELRTLTESSIECEARKTVLEHEVCKLRQKIGKPRTELVNVKKRMIQFENRLGRLKLQAQADQDEILALKLSSACDNGLKSDDLNENIKNLKVLCKAKELEMKEKEKRYQSNYRTLLRKVKEHMRGRNTAEKHCQYLRDLHDKLAEELSTCKLQKAVQAIDFQNVQSEYENFKNNNVKMKRDLSHLQRAKEELDKHKEEIRKLESSLRKQVINNDQLDEKNQNLSTKLTDLSDDFSNLERQFQVAVDEKRNVYDQLLQERQRNTELTAAADGNEMALQQAKAEKEFLNDEVESLKMKLTCNVNELAELREQQIFLDTKRKLEEIIINNLKSDIQVVENDLNAVRSDKYFLQRLCNDLKSALTTSKNQNENLRKQMTVLPSDIQEIPSPSKYDDEFINKLLKQSLTPLTEKPLYELHNNLNSLKKEMLSLQKQIINCNM